MENVAVHVDNVNGGNIEKQVYNRVDIEKKVLVAVREEGQRTKHIIIYSAEDSANEDSTVKE